MPPTFTPEDAYNIGARGSRIDDVQRAVFERYMTKRGFKKYFAFNKVKPNETHVEGDELKQAVLKLHEVQSIADGSIGHYREQMTNICWTVWRDRSNLIANALGQPLYLSQAILNRRPGAYDPDEMNADRLAFEQYMAGHCWKVGPVTNEPESKFADELANEPENNTTHEQPHYQNSMSQTCWEIWSDFSQMERLALSALVQRETDQEVLLSRIPLVAGQRN